MRNLKRMAIPVGIGLSLLSVLGVYAADISQATYKGLISITNNGTTTATNQSVTFTLNTTSLINAGFVNSALNNTAMLNDAGADNPFMPGASGNFSWVTWMGSSLPSSTTLPYVLYMGGNQSMSSNIAYFPGAAGMNATDNVSLELGGNWTINQTAFIDTSAGANKNLVYKPGAFTTNLSGASNITSWPTGLTGAFLTAYNIIPAGAGANTDLPNLFGAATHWQACLTNDGNTSYVSQNVATTQKYDLFTTNASTLRNAANITIYIVAEALNSAADALVNTAIYTHSTAYLGDTIQLSTGGGGNTSGGQYHTYNTTYTTNPNTGLAWTADEINSLQIGGQINIAAGQDARITQVYAVVSSIYDTFVSAPNVATGEHTIVTSLDSGNLSLLVDGVVQSSNLVTGNVTNTANDWQFCVSNTTIYIYSTNISINGTQQAYWKWQYIPVGGTIQFTDNTGKGHTAIPTFRTSGSSVNVTANMSGLSPISQSVSPVTQVALASNLTTAFTAPTTLYTELNIQVPGAALINDILDGVSIPRAVFWFPVLFGLIGLAGLLTYWLTKSMLIQAAIMAFVMIVLSLMGGFGYWVCIEFIIMALAFVLGSKQFGF